MDGMHKGVGHRQQRIQCRAFVPTEPGQRVVSDTSCVLPAALRPLAGLIDRQ